jgi:hypothetical protein
MLLISISRLLYAKNCTRMMRRRASESQDTDGDGAGVCLGDSIALQNGRGDDGCEPDQHINEIRGNDSHNADGRDDGSVADVEAGLAQNGHDGPVDCDQIEMSSAGQGIGMAL